MPSFSFVVALKSMPGFDRNRYRHQFSGFVAALTVTVIFSGSGLVYYQAQSLNARLYLTRYYGYWRRCKERYYDRQTVAERRRWAVQNSIAHNHISSFLVASNSISYKYHLEGNHLTPNQPYPTPPLPRRVIHKSSLKHKRNTGTGASFENDWDGHKWIIHVDKAGTVVTQRNWRNPDKSVPDQCQIWCYLFIHVVLDDLVFDDIVWSFPGFRSHCFWHGTR